MAFLLVLLNGLEPDVARILLCEGGDFQQFSWAPGPLSLCTVGCAPHDPAVALEEPVKGHGGSRPLGSYVLQSQILDLRSPVPAVAWCQGPLCMPSPPGVLGRSGPLRVQGGNAADFPR